MAIEKIFVPYRPGNADKYILCKIDVTYYDKLDFSGEIEGANVDPPDTENGKPADTESEKPPDTKNKKPPDTESAFYSNILHSYFDKYNKQKGHFKCVIEPRDGSPTEIVLNEDTPSALLGVFLQSLHVANNWSYKDTWGSITVTGTFVDKDNDKGVLALAAIKDYQYKFKGEFKEYAEEHTDGKPHLFLYISNDKSLENESTENIQVKAFSPDQDTLFDVLDYVFKLPTFPEALYEKQQQFFEDFENKTEKFWQEKTIVPMADSCKEAIRLIDENPKKSFFIHGIKGCRKSYLAYQIVRNLVWNDKKYMPVWIAFKNDKAMDFSLVRSGTSMADEIWKGLSEKLTEDDSKTCLVVIDGLDIGRQILDDFLSHMNNCLVNKNNIIIIYTGIAKYSTKFENYFTDYTPSGFTKDELIYFIDKIPAQNSQAKNGINSIKQGTDESRKLYDSLIEFLHKNCGNLPDMIRFIINSLNRPSVTIGDFLNDTATSSTDDGIDMTNTLKDFYKSVFDLLNANAKHLLLYLLNFNDEYTPIEKLKENIAYVIPGQPERDKITAILNDRKDFRSVLDELANNFLIDFTKDSSDIKDIKINDSILYKTLLFEDDFSAGGLRENLVSEYKMLKYYVMQSFFMNINKDENEDENERIKQIEMLKFRLNRFGKRLKEIEYEGGCNILHGVARFCGDTEIFDFLLKEYRDLFYSTDKNNEKKFVTDALGHTAFQYAAADNRNLNILEWFQNNLGKKPGKEMEKEDYLNSRSEITMNHALHFAAEFNKEPSIMKFFLKNEFIRFTNEKNKYGYTPLLYACWKNTPEIVKLLLDKLKEGEYNIVNESRNLNYLHICFVTYDKQNNIKVEKRELNDIKEIIGSIKEYAGENGFKSLLEGKDEDGNIPLHYALYFFDNNTNMEEIEKIEKIKELLNELYLSDMDLLNARNNMGFTPLHNAAMRCQPEIVSFLVKNGAKITNHSYASAGSFGSIYPIHYAAQYSKYPGNAKILCGGNINLLNIPDNCGSTPLHYAIEAKNYTMIDALIKLGADIYKPDIQGTPLELAVKSGIPSSFIKR